MAEFIARMFTPPKKDAPRQQAAPSRAAGPKPAAAQSGVAKKKTVSRVAPRREEDEARTARKTLLGQ